MSTWNEFTQLIKRVSENCSKRIVNIVNIVYKYITHYALKYIPLNFSSIRNIEWEFLDVFNFDSFCRFRNEKNIFIHNWFNKISLSESVDKNKLHLLFGNKFKSYPTKQRNIRHFVKM